MTEQISKDINFDDELIEPAFPPKPKPEKTPYEIQQEEWRKRYNEMSDDDKAIYEAYGSYGGWGE